MAEKTGETLNRFFSTVRAAAFLAAAFLFLPHAADAASVYLSPASGTYKVGQTFTVGVYVTSADQAVNAYSGTITFPGDQVEVTALSKTGITSLWVQDPSFSNSRGTATFEGIVLNPGFTGNGGKIITLTFKAKKAGTVPVRLTDGSVLANDGEGTNILSGFGHGSFTISEGVTPPVPAPSPTPTPAPTSVKGVPTAPTISSSTHPDPNAWYNNKNPAFAWVMPSGITGGSVLIDRNEKQDPGTLSGGVFSTYDVKDVGDGVWFFHVKLKNSKGWGSAAHFRFQVDATAPAAPQVREEEGTTLFLKSTDALSGVERFEVAINGQPPLKFPASKDAETEAALPSLAIGEHTLAIRAVDRAGNVSAETPFKVRILALEPPRLTDVPDVVYSDAALRVLGDTIPDGLVTVRVTSVGEDAAVFEVKADTLGRFGLTFPKRLSIGTYVVSAKVKDEAGRESGWTEDFTFRVQDRPVFNWLLLILFSLPAILLSVMCLILLRALHKEKKEADDLKHKFHELQLAFYSLMSEQEVEEARKQKWSK